MITPDSRLSESKLLFPESELLHELYQAQLREDKGASRLAACQRHQLDPDTGVGLNVSVILMGLDQKTVEDPTKIDAETWQKLEQARIEDNNIRNRIQHQKEQANVLKPVNHKRLDLFESF